MPKQYGISPWGRALMETLQNEAYDSRLARGKTYANTGRVYAIRIGKEGIKARVRGNYQSYYKVEFNFKAFSAEEIETIKQLLQENLLNFGALLNGELSEGFLDQLEQHEVNLFKGFGMDCDCWDFDPYWSSPCKHICALYFIVVREIDKNPFFTVLVLRTLIWLSISS